MIGVTLSIPAEAQQTCVPEVEGVPGGLNAPNWWDPGQADYAYTTEDPRWSGSVAMTWAEEGGGTDHTNFRALYDANNLYLSWRAIIDPSPDEDEDVLHVIFGSPTGASPASPDVRIEVKPLLDPNNEAMTLPIEAMPALHRTLIRTQPGDAWLDVDPEPQWLDDLRAWASVDADNLSWAVNMRVPRSSSVPADGILIDPTSNNLRLWFEFQVTHAGGTTRYDWPRDVAAKIDPTTLTLVFPDIPSSAPQTPCPYCFWFKNTGVDSGAQVPGASELHLVSSQSEVTCSNVGVVFAWSDIAPTTNPIPSQILYPDIPNTFVATPTNMTGDLILEHAVVADFSIANWGSQAIGADAPAGFQLWTVIPGGDGVSNAALVPDGSPIELTFPWTIGSVNDPYYDALNDGTMHHHQCVFVELDAPGADVTLVNSSAWRNMNFVETSSIFSRDAQISIVGLDPLPGTRQTRDVFLYVETRNMPRFASGPAKNPTAQLRELGATDVLGRNSRVQLDSVVPTYRVHAYHDTGERLTVDGVTRPFLRAQSSFGYRVRHDGEVAGWRHRLEGADLLEIAPNVYKIAVPNGGFATVTTTIEAVEPRQFALSLHGGVSVPHGTFSSTSDPGFGATVDLAYRMTSLASFEVLFGFHRFPGAGSGEDLNVLLGAGSVKLYASSSRVRPFVSAGSGSYKFDPGSTDVGVLGGGGVQVNASIYVALELSYTLHDVFTSGANTRFSSIQGGARIRF
jgi:hypothetical protein